MPAEAVAAASDGKSRTEAVTAVAFCAADAFISRELAGFAHVGLRSVVCCPIFCEPKALVPLPGTPPLCFEI